MHRFLHFVFCPLFFALCLLPFAVSAQSPWARSKAGFYAQASWQFIPAYPTLFGADGGDIELAREVAENNVQLYGEYGIGKKTTVTAALPLVWSRRGSINPASPYVVGQVDSGSILGLGNVQLSLRHQFLAGKIVLAGTLRLGLPASTSEQSTGLRTGYDALTVLPTLSAGMGLGKAYWFVYGGYGYRSNNYSSFLNAGVEGGVKLWRVWLIGFSEYLGSLENGSRSIALPDVSTGLYENDQGWLSLGLKTLIECHRFWGVNLSAAGAAWGQYVPQRPAFSAGLYFKWE
mgnify:CR=1 FL=1